MVLNVNMPQFVQEESKFSALDIDSRYFKSDGYIAPEWRDTFPEPTGPVFFCEPDGGWGPLCSHYPSEFKGPSNHHYCTDLICKYCEDSRKTFTCVDHYVQFYQAIFFGDHASAAQILLKGGLARNNEGIKGFHQEAWDAVKDDIEVQANMWKFSQDGCKASGYDMTGIPTGTPLQDVLLYTGNRRIAKSNIDDSAWADIYFSGRAVHRMSGAREPSDSDYERLRNAEDDARFHDEEFDDDREGRLLMEVRARIRGGETPRRWHEFRSVYDEDDVQQYD